MVVPPIGGRNTLRSGRVTSSGYMPPVCSCRPRRKSVSSSPKRSAIDPVWYLPGIAERFGHVDMGAGDRDGRPHVVAAREVSAEDLAHQVSPRIERYDLLGIAPLRVR